jgi:glycosyltransferase involved in cell wall biosynthesis
MRAARAVTPASHAETYAGRDALVGFEDERPVGVWAHRSRHGSFVVPFVGATRSHYLPASHAPGTFEVPIDRDLPCWSPLVFAHGTRYTGGGAPDRLEHQAGSITAVWERLDRSGGGIDDDRTDVLTGRREMRLFVDGRALVLDDDLTLDQAPDAIAYAIPATRTRPLHVTVECDVPHATSAVTVDGVAEWSSAYSALAVVHQVDLDPAPHVRTTIRVTPALRVASTSFGHHYHESLYRPMAERVVDRPSPLGPLGDPSVRLSDIDLFHLHWPEWCGFDDLDAHNRIITELRDYAIPIVWTAHNLTPHDHYPDRYDPIYQRWAEAADAVIHHSRWGEARMRARYRFPENCRHEVIPHGHFGGLWTAARGLTRDEAERRLGLPPAALRIGLVGAPRRDKLAQAVLDGVAASQRRDVQLVCWSLVGSETVPDDPRIAVARPYRQVDAAAYATRLVACDALVFPFDPDGDMLATGTVFDAIGLGMPSLASSWGFLTEVLGAAAIPCGHTPESIAACIDGLTEERLTEAATAARALRAELEWEPIAERTLALFDRVVLGEP